MLNNYKVNLKRILKLTRKLGLNIIIDGSYKQAQYKPANKWLRSKGVAGRVWIPSPDIREMANDQQKAMWYLATEILHEVGHFIVAAPSRRAKKDYGILLNGNEYWEIEELRAFLVERKLCELFGIKAKGNNPLVNYSWGLKNKYKTRAELRKWWKEIGEQQTIKAFKEGIV